MYEGEYRNGKRDGRGVYMYASGDVYEGEYKSGKMEGRGTYRLADGTAEVGRYFSGADVGEGARWSADRKSAYRLRGGNFEEEISLDEAARIATALGLPVPAIWSTEDAEETGDEDAAAATPPAEPAAVPSTDGGGAPSPDTVIITGKEPAGAIESSRTIAPVDISPPIAVDS